MSPATAVGLTYRTCKAQCGGDAVEPEESVCKLSEDTPLSGPVLPDSLSIHLSYHKSTIPETHED